jgi:hypothetical protein
MGERPRGFAVAARVTPTHPRIHGSAIAIRLISPSKPHRNAHPPSLVNHTPHPAAGGKFLQERFGGKKLI